MPDRIKIVTNKEEMKEGLFGQVILFAFEVLPYLYSKSIYPEWDIKSDLYGLAPDHTVIPGVLDLAYIPPPGRCKQIQLKRLLGTHAGVLGNDWLYMNELWNAYFKIPERIHARAKGIVDPDNSLGLHYRGTDKNTSIKNPVTQSDMLILTKDFVRRHNDIKSIFVASDESSLAGKVKERFPSLSVISLGPVGFHKSEIPSREKADRALLDCLLLSRCRYMLKCSSALSGFAKVLNPKLEAWRVAACELYADVPYFPDAYIPRFESDDPECRLILERIMETDWLNNADVRRRYEKPFRTKSRYPWWARLRRRIQYTLLNQW